MSISDFSSARQELDDLARRIRAALQASRQERCNALHHDLDIGDMLTVRGDFFKLFKVHGSINWVREIDSTILNVQEKNHSDLVREFIDKVPYLQVSDRFRCVTRSLDDPVGKIDSKPVFPAIAIPVETKVSFECPSDHLDALSRHLPEVTHVLTIGWRGNEAHFLKLLEAGFNGRSVLFQTVASGKPDAEAVLARIKGAGINASGEATPYGGFTDYVVRREAEKFFRS